MPSPAAAILIVLALLASGCQPESGEVPPPTETSPDDGAAASSAEESQRYLGLDPPGLEPEVFAPGIVSLEERSEFGSVFTANGLEFYFGIDFDGRTETWATVWDGDRWPEPTRLVSHPVYGANDPFLDPSEQRLYFISDRPLDGEGEPKDIDLWYVERRGETWSEPIHGGPGLNSESEEYYISFTADGTAYLGSNRAAEPEESHDFDLYAARWVDGGFETPAALPGAVNTPDYEADVYVAPDESYVIFSSRRQEGLGRGDLYLSVRGADGQWSEARNLGAPINTEGHELCPFVTLDGRYLLYTSRQQIYWVDAAILDPFLQ